MDETQAGIKIAGRNINNLRYADDTTLMAESEEELIPAYSALCSLPPEAHDQCVTPNMIST